jgi:TonB family protein
MAFKQVVANLVVLTALASAFTAKADDPAAVRTRLEKATAVSSLDDLTSKPWHAKLSITLFDAKGKNPVDATIEFWKSGDDWLRVITAGLNTETTLRHDGKTYGGVSGSGAPGFAEEVFQEFLHPGPLPIDFEDTTPELRKQNFGKVSLDCIMLSRPIKRVAFAPLGLFPTYCLDPGTDHLRLSYDFGSRAVTINAGGKFLDRQVATQFSMSEGAIVVATAKVVSLATFNPSPDTFQPASQLAPVVTPVARISSGVMQGMRLSSLQPVYPEDARARGVTGTVVLRAIIGRDGHIHTLRVMSAPDPSLAISALAAVRQWTYRPYLLNGESTEVDTTIIVNYNLSGG